VYANGTRYWRTDGVLHRENGPAIIYSDGVEEFWLNGIQQPNPEEVKELTVAGIEMRLGYRVKIVKSEE
jgi:hypothetical protein